MTIQFRCPSGHRLSVDDRRAGEFARCPRCKAVVQVPHRPGVAQALAGQATETAEGGQPRARRDSPWADMIDAELRGAAHEKATAKAPPPVPPELPEASSPKPAVAKPRPGPPPLPSRPKVAAAGKPPPSGAKPPRRRPAAAETPPAAAAVPSAGATAGLSSSAVEADDNPGHVGPQQVADGRSKPAPADLPATPGATAGLPSSAAGAVEEAGDLSQKPAPDASPGHAPAEPSPGGPAGDDASVHQGRRERRRRRPRQSHETSDAEPASPEDKAAQQQPGPRRRDRSGRRRQAAQPQLMPPDVYRPDRGRVQTVKWLALLLGLCVAFSTLPAFRVFDLNLQAPGWARVVLLVALMQAVYVAWMLIAPDWASVWIVMLVFALVAALYGMITAIVLATRPGDVMPLGLDAVRQVAAGWCTAVMLVMALATYLCGRTSAKWRRAYELEVANRARASRRQARAAF